MEQAYDTQAPGYDHTVGRGIGALMWQLLGDMDVGEAPVALLELMPREYARRSGYITGVQGEEDETLTIVCLEVAFSHDRKEMMRAMVSHLTRNLEQFKSYRRLEVGAFPRDVDFHPAFVYRENGFEVAEDGGEALVLSIPIPQ